MGRQLDELDPAFRPYVETLLARLTEAQIHVVITSTGRTAEEQAEAVRTGHSKVTHSRHQDGMAIDLVPLARYELHGPDKLQWDLEDPVWWKIGAIVEQLGLRWGGRFGGTETKLGWDPGHCELAAESLAAALADQTPSERLLRGENHRLRNELAAAKLRLATAGLRPPQPTDHRGSDGAA